MDGNLLVPCSINKAVLKGNILIWALIAALLEVERGKALN